jgi:hypothetical protein
MLITNGSRQIVIKLKKYSVKQSSARNHHRNQNNGKSSTNQNDDQRGSNDNIDSTSSSLAEPIEHRSLLGYILGCKPCQNVTDNHQNKIVCYCVFASSLSLSLSVFSLSIIERTNRFNLILQDNDKTNWEDSEANLYWKYKAVEYFAKTQEADKVQEKLDNLSNR